MLNSLPVLKTQDLNDSWLRGRRGPDSIPFGRPTGGGEPSAQRVAAERVAAQRMEAHRVAAQQMEAQLEEAQRVRAQRLEAQRVEAQREARRRQQQEEEAAQRRQQEEAQRVAAQPASGGMDEWVQSTFGPSGFDWPVEMCAALSAALAEEELVTAESVAKMDDGDVDDIVQNAGLKKGPAQNFKEGHAALQKAI